MGRLLSGLLFPVACLALAWVAGCGSLKVLQKPTCVSDYLNLSTCEWSLDQPLNCSTALRLSYQLLFDPEPFIKNHTCVPENSADTACVCHMGLRDLAIVDVYQLDLWAGTQLLWSHNFTPSQHVRPIAPVNLTVSTNVSTGWLLLWSHLYPPWNYLHNKLTYQVHISSESEPENVRVYNVTYKETAFHLEARELVSGVSYSARVRARAQLEGSTWSDWSLSASWENYYAQPLEQHLKLGVVIACCVVVLVCLSCYCSVTKIKREWWDQIPNPACSPVVAIVIQDPQVSPWEKQPRGREPSKCPHWKTCLTKLLPCLMEHGVKKDGDLPKVARNRPLQVPGRPAWCPVEISKTVLLPETISVVRRVELFEAPGKVEEEEDVEEDEEKEDSGVPQSEAGLPDGRESIAARLTESLFLGLLGAEEGSTCPPSPGAPWAREGPPQPAPALVIEDNPAYRSFSHFGDQAQSPGELGPGTLLAEPPEEGDFMCPGGPQSSEPPTWEQILRQCVLQHGAAPVLPTAPSGGYREFVQAVMQGGPQDGSGTPSPSGEAGYKASPSLVSNSVTWEGLAGPGAGSEDGAYRPLQSLSANCPGAPATVPQPLFSFGLDMEPPPSPQSLLLPHSPLGISLGPEVREEDEHKPLLPLQQATEPLRDDLGIVYSALTCHLCGHLKQCPGQEEAGQPQVAASPCCGCCCGDRGASLGPPPAKHLLDASLCLASLVPKGLSEEESKPSLPSHLAPCGAHSLSTKVLGLLPTGLPSMEVS